LMDWFSHAWNDSVFSRDLISLGWRCGYPPFTGLRSQRESGEITLKTIRIRGISAGHVQCHFQSCFPSSRIRRHDPPRSRKRVEYQMVGNPEAATQSIEASQSTTRPTSVSYHEVRGSHTNLQNGMIGLDSNRKKTAASHEEAAAWMEWPGLQGRRQGGMMRPYPRWEC